MKTWKAVAKHLGISDRALRAHRQRGDWPKGVPKTLPKRGLNKTHIKKLVEWQKLLRENRAAEARANGRAKPSEADDLRLRERRIQVELKEIELERQRAQVAEQTGRNITLDEHEQAMAGLAKLVIRELIEPIEKTWPSRLANKQIAQLRRLIPKLLDSYRLRLADHVEVDCIRLEELQASKAQKVRGRGRGRPGSKRR